MSARVRPLIFVDVDGPLIPLRERPGTPPVVAADPSGHPLIHRLDPADGPRLLALGGDLVWATTWMQAANEVVGPRLGLPPLPVVAFPDDDRPAGGGLHWKTLAVMAWAADRAFVWLDDEVTGRDRRWVRDFHPRPALVHRVHPHAGLTAADFAEVSAWLADLGQDPPDPGCR
ncbi:hypothetical protein SAMN05421541_10961 [Actinoplanes philippinensis]|uniref:Secreted protein n=1 Tax=Actinoplanes philippinensis TaxID=35752 RepID=A0A1I2HX86_9ACTN|nr:hypothetical protein SAMN05421541_10961 [Actinoplanes philippinensis]